MKKKKIYIYVRHIVAKKQTKTIMTWLSWHVSRPGPTLPMRRERCRTHSPFKGIHFGQTDDGFGEDNDGQLRSGKYKP